MIPLIVKNRPGYVLLFFCLVSVFFIALIKPAQAASCVPPTTDLGTVTQTVSIPSAGTYRLWSNMQSPSASDNTYLFEIDGAGATACYDVGGTAMTPQSWTWVDYQAGTTATPIDISLPAAGQYTVKLIGNAPGVELDRVILTQDTTCVPSGTGDNCANPPDTTPPIVSLTSPKNGATIHGTTQLSALASDDTAVASVSFYIDSSGVPVATVPTPGGVSSTTPQTYSTSFDASTLSNGPHSLQARATDTSGNIGDSSTVTVNVDNSSSSGCMPPSTPTNVTEVSASISSITLSWSASTPGGNCTLTGYKVFRNGVELNTSLDTADSYEDSGLSAGMTYQYSVEAVDSDGSISPLSASAGLSTTVDNVPPTITLTTPDNGADVSGDTTIAGTATDNVDVASVVIEVDGLVVDTEHYSDSALGEPFTYSWNTTGLSNGQHALSVLAYDEAGNVGTEAINVVVENGDTTPPSTPTGLTATAPSFNRVDLFWQAATDNVGVAGYYVLRNGATIARLNAITTYVDTSVSAGTSYRYQVMAFDAAGNNSALSTAVQVSTPKAANTVPPSAPTALTAVPVSSNQIDLTWHASTNAVTSYNVYRAVGGNTHCGVTHVGYCAMQLIRAAVVRIATHITTTSFGDNGLKPATTYTYYVTAINAAGKESKKSSPALATTYTATSPTGITTGIVDGTVHHNGAPFTSADVRYTVAGKTTSFSTAAGGAYVFVGVPAGNRTFSYSAPGFTTTRQTIHVMSGMISSTSVTLRHISRRT